MNEIIATPFVHIIWGLVIILLVTALINRTYRELLLVLAIVLLIPAPLLTKSLQVNVVESTSPPASLRAEPVPAPPVVIPLPLESVPMSVIKPKQAFTQTQADAGYGYNPKPKYPSIARSQGWEGKVIIRVLISVKGYSEQVTVVHSSGYDVLDNEAVSAVEKWRFIPAKRGDTAIASTQIIPINFKLD